MFNQDRMITVLVVASLLLFAFIGIASTKTKFDIMSNVPLSSVLVDGKQTTLIDGQSLLLGPGSHKISVSRSYYETFTKQIFIFPFIRKDVEITLSLDSTGKDITQKALLVTEATAKYSKSGNSNDYLEFLKKHLEEETYAGVVFQIEDSLRSKKTTTPNTFPKVYLPINGSYIEETKEGALVSVRVNKKGDVAAVERLGLMFTKVNSKWLISNILYF